MLSARNKSRTAQRPVTQLDENRYINVKRSMAGIKHCLDERKKIKYMIKGEEMAEEAKAAKLAEAAVAAESQVKIEA